MEMCSIVCRCGHAGTWDEFSVSPGQWACPSCGAAWDTRLVDAETVAGGPLRECAVCGKPFVPKKMACGVITARKSCSTKCWYELRARNAREQYAPRMIPRLVAGAEREMGWMRRAEMCPVV